MTPNSPAFDDEEFDPEEIHAATDETPTEMSAPEVDSATRNLTKWDEPAGASGAPAPKVLPEDEIPVAEQLVAEGTDEADRERRMAAADPDFEP